jgi:hypothetical protein
MQMYCSLEDAIPVATKYAEYIKKTQEEMELKGEQPLPFSNLVKVLSEMKPLLMRNCSINSLSRKLSRAAYWFDSKRGNKVGKYTKDQVLEAIQFCNNMYIEYIYKPLFDEDEIKIMYEKYDPDVTQLLDIDQLSQCYGRV